MPIKRHAGDIHWNELNQCTEPLSQPSFDLRRTSTVDAVRESNAAHFIPDILDGKSMVPGIVLRSTQGPYPYMTSGVEKLYSEFTTVDLVASDEASGDKTYWRYEVMITMVNGFLKPPCSVLPDSSDQEVINYYTTAIPAPGLWGTAEEGDLPVGTSVDIMFENLKGGRVPQIIKVNLDRAIVFETCAPIVEQYKSAPGRRLAPAGTGGTFRTAMVIGDSMSSTPLSVGGRIGKMLKDRGFEVRTHKPAGFLGGGAPKIRGVPFTGHPLGVATYPGRHVPYLLGDSRLQKILANFNAELLVVILGANSASSAQPTGTYIMSRRARKEYKVCMEDYEGVISEFKKEYEEGKYKDKNMRSCFQVGHKTRKSLAEREAIYKTQLETFVQTAYGAGVKYIIWLGPSYMSGIHGKEKYGKHGLEWGAENIRRWQSETLPGLNVEWHDSLPMTRNIRPGHDGLHFGTDSYGMWATTASKVIFNNVKAGA